MRRRRCSSRFTASRASGGRWSIRRTPARRRGRSERAAAAPLSRRSPSCTKPVCTMPSPLTVWGRDAGGGRRRQRSGAAAGACLAEARGRVQRAGAAVRRASPPPAIPRYSAASPSSWRCCTRPTFGDDTGHRPLPHGAAAARRADDGLGGPGPPVVAPATSELADIIEHEAEVAEDVGRKPSSSTACDARQLPYDLDGRWRRSAQSLERHPQHAGARAAVERLIVSGARPAGPGALEPLAESGARLRQAARAP